MLSRFSTVPNVQIELLYQYHVSALPRAEAVPPCQCLSPADCSVEGSRSSGQPPKTSSYHKCWVGIDQKIVKSEDAVVVWCLRMVHGDWCC